MTAWRVTSGLLCTLNSERHNWRKVRYDGSRNSAWYELNVLEASRRNRSLDEITAPCQPDTVMLSPRHCSVVFVRQLKLREPTDFFAYNRTLLLSTSWQIRHIGVDFIPVMYIKLFLLFRNIYHLTETLGIVSMDLQSNCLSVAGTQNPLAQHLVRLPLPKPPKTISVIKPQWRERASK